MPHMSNVITIDGYNPRVLTPEPWGARLARARDEAGWTVRGVEAAMRGFPGMSRGSISRLESLESAPTGAKERHRALLLVLLYGYDPADFDLGPDDVPPLIDLNQIVDLGVSSTIWYYQTLTAA